MKYFGLKLIRGFYRRVPLPVRTRFERLISPITRRIFIAGLSWAPPPTVKGRPVSIVIPSYNDIQLLRPLLRSIEKTVRNREFEVIISDDYCVPNNTALLKSLESSVVRVVTSEARTGFAGAVNRGLVNARWDVVLLNSDMIALPGWLDWLEYCAYEVDPLVGMVSPHLIYPTGRIQYGGTYQNRVGAPQWFSHLFQGKPANYKPAQGRRYVRANCGAAIYVTKKALDAIGPLDDQYWLGFEDVDWSYKAWNAGFRCMIEPSSRLIHLESATRGFSQGPREYGSMRRFWRKWKAWPPLLTQESRLVIVHAQPDDPTMTQLSGSMAAALENHLGLEVIVHAIAGGVTVDETLIDLYTTPHYRFLALDRGSLVSVWLASVGRSTPLVYFDDFELAQINISSNEDLALLSPEFDFAVTNRDNLARLRTSLPWGVSLVGPPATAQIAESHAELLNEILVVEASDQLAGELRDALQAEFTITFLSRTDLVRKLLSNPARGLQGKVILFGRQLSTSTVALSAMSQGAIIFYQQSAQVAFDLLDGYNSFSYHPGDLPTVVAQLSHLVQYESARRELIENGTATCANVSKAFAQQIQSLLQLSGQLHLPESEFPSAFAGS